MDAFNDNKAGMSGLDKEKIQRIIEKNTGMNFNNHSLKQRQRIEERINRNNDLLGKLTEEQLDAAQQEMDVLAQSIEAERDLSRTVVHFDMDMFFAAVEMRDEPRLRTIPMAVGGESMLSTSNYIARTFGVRSAMPGFIAKKLCPDLVIVHGHYDRYRKESSVVRKIFQQYDESVRMGSLDEASLDLTTFLRSRGAEPSVPKQKRVRYDPKWGCICRLPLVSEDETISEEATHEESNCNRCAKKRRAIVDFVEFGNDVDSVVLEIRFLVEQATGLTCSAGIAANWMLSKICSDINKPNGQFRLNNNRDEIINFMRDLPIRKVSGIGKVTEAILSGLDITHCGDLFTKRAILKILFSEISSDWFLHVALGSSGSGWSESEEDNNRKSISVERTFSPQKDIGILLDTARELCQMLIESIFESNIEGGKSVTLKIKFASFDVITRCHSTDFLVRSLDVLYPIVRSLLKKEMKFSSAIRLLGVRLSRLKFITGRDGDCDESYKKESLSQRTLTEFIYKRECSSWPPTKQVENNDPRMVRSPELIELSSDEGAMCNGSVLKGAAADAEADIWTESTRHLQDSSRVCKLTTPVEVQNPATRDRRKRPIKRSTEGKSSKKGCLTRFFPVELT